MRAVDDDVRELLGVFGRENADATRQELAALRRSIDAWAERMDKRCDLLDEMFARMRERLDSMNTRIEARLERSVIEMRALLTRV